MSLTRKLAYNTIFQMIGRFGGGILAVAGIALITRSLGREGFGIYTTVTSFLMFFGILINFGLITITVQMISERDEEIEKILNNILTLRFISSIIFLGIAPLISLLFPYSSIITKGIALTSFAFLFQMMTETVMGLFQKKLAMQKPALAEFFSRIIFVGLIALFVYLKYGILSMLLALNIANFTWFAAVFYFANKLVKIRPAFDFAIWKTVLVRAWPIGLSILLNLIYLKADVIILSVFQNQETVGLYGAPYKLIDAITTFAMMLMGLILPLLASSWAKGLKTRFAFIFQKTLHAMIIVVAPMIVGTYFVGEKIMIFIAGDDFAASGPILSILVLGAGALFLGALFAHTIVAIDKQKQVLWGYGVDAALSLVAYFIFIPRYSYFGAAWVTFFSEIFIALWSMFIIYKYTKIIPSFAIVGLKSALATIPMAVALYFWRGAHILLLLPLAAIIYAFFIILFRGVKKEEIAEILSLRKEV